MDIQAQHRKTTVAGILIGIGMGGFIDGILLHQIFQWHSMVSNWIPPITMDAMKINMLWDGIFHALVWVVTLIGILLLWNAAYHRRPIPSLQSLMGQFLLGWGLFNLVEGIIDHQILAIHYVRQVSNFTVYNLTFLVVGGVLFIVLGWTLIKTADTR